MSHFDEEPSNPLPSTIIPVSVDPPEFADVKLMLICFLIKDYQQYGFDPPPTPSALI